MGAAAQFAVTLVIVARWIGPGALQPVTLSPATFLAPVGSVLVPLAGVQLGFVEISWFFFSVGLVLWLVVLTMLIARLFALPTLPDRLLPTLMMLIAPPSLLMLAYLRLDPDAGHVFARVLYYASVFFLMVVLTQLRRLIRIDFALSWWAYTFPLAAFTIATLTFAERTGINELYYLGAITYLTLACLVAGLSGRTLLAFWRREIFLPEP